MQEIYHDKIGDTQNLWSKIDKIIPRILKIRKIYHERVGEKGKMKFNLLDLRSECEILETERRAKSWSIQSAEWNTNWKWAAICVI